MKFQENIFIFILTFDVKVFAQQIYYHLFLLTNQFFLKMFFHEVIFHTFNLVNKNSLMRRYEEFVNHVSCQFLLLFQITNFEQDFLWYISKRQDNNKNCQNLSLNILISFDEMRIFIRDLFLLWQCNFNFLCIIDT